MIRQNFEKQLEELNEELLKMGSLVEERIYKAVTSLKEKDLELAEEVSENDDDLDDYELEIEQKCIKLIALQQPVAKDLRQINMISKMATDLERIGDLAQNISWITMELEGEELIKPLVDIPRMSELVQLMVREALTAFVEQDAKKAKQVAQKDDQVDELDEQILRELLTYMMEDPSAIRQCNSLIFVSRYLERIGDHATNICERIVYMVTADRVSY